MTTTHKATIKDLYSVRGKAEIVNGEIVEMPPTGYLPGYAASRILFSLITLEQTTGSGHAIGDNVGFRVNLSNRGSFSPDVAWYTGKPAGMKFLEGAPVFAVEVRSENDYGPDAERAIAQKRADCGSDIYRRQEPGEEVGLQRREQPADFGFHPFRADAGLFEVRRSAQRAGGRHARRVVAVMATRPPRLV